MSDLLAAAVKAAVLAWVLVVNVGASAFALATRLLDIASEILGLHGLRS